MFQKWLTYYTFQGLVGLRVTEFDAMLLAACMVYQPTRQKQARSESSFFLRSYLKFGTYVTQGVLSWNPRGQPWSRGTRGKIQDGAGGHFYFSGLPHISLEMS